MPINWQKMQDNSAHKVCAKRRKIKKLAIMMQPALQDREKLIRQQELKYFSG